MKALGLVASLAAGVVLAAQVPAPVSVTATAVLGWDYPTTGVPMVISWSVCLDGSTCVDVGQPAQKPQADTLPGEATYTAPLSIFGAKLTSGPHVISVFGANSQGQTTADHPLNITVDSLAPEPPPPPPAPTGPPAKATHLRIIGD